MDLRSSGKNAAAIALGRLDVPAGRREPIVFRVVKEDLSVRFRQLADAWRKKASHLSSPSRRAMIPEYQQIIGLGPAAVPLLLEELKHTPALWFWALRAITGDDPVPPSERGNNETMAESWVDWGKARNLC